jgi:hypothetical protein
MSRRIVRTVLLLVVVGGVGWYLPRSGPFSVNLSVGVPLPVTVHIDNPSSVFPSYHQYEPKYEVQDVQKIVQKTLSSKQVSILSSITAFSRYLENALDKVTIRKEKFGLLPAHQRPLAKAIGYSSHFENARTRARYNAKFLSSVADYAREIYGFDPEDETSTAHYEYVFDFLGHMVRDWSAEGKHERDTVFPPILNALRDGLAGIKEEKRVLVPGFGLGRLAHEIANDKGIFHVLVYLRNYSLFCDQITRSTLASSTMVQSSHTTILSTGPLLRLNIPSTPTLTTGNSREPPKDASTPLASQTYSLPLLSISSKVTSSPSFRNPNNTTLS